MRGFMAGATSTGLSVAMQHAGGKIVGMAAGHLGQQVGRRGRHHDQVGLARQADVADLALVVEVEQFGEHALVGQRADRERRHELLGGPGHHGAHGDAALAQAADQVEALVGRNPAADDENDRAWRGLLHVKQSRRGPRRDAMLGLLRHVSPHLVRGLERDAVALAQVGDQMPVVDGGNAELGGRQAGFCEEGLDLGQQLFRCTAHSHSMMGNYP